MIRRAEGWPQPWMSRSGASPGAHPCNAWIFRSARASSSHSPCREGFLHVHHGREEDPGKKAGTLTQTGKNQPHSLTKKLGGGRGDKGKGLFLQKISTPLPLFKQTRTFQQHSPSFLPKKDLQRKSSEG